MGLFAKHKSSDSKKKVKIQEGQWVKCPSCKKISYKKEIEDNVGTCPKCNYHFRINAVDRIKLIVDEGSFSELDSKMESIDPLDFNDIIPYKKRLEENKAKSGLNDAVLYGDALINEREIVLAVLDFAFMGGSMGLVVGEKIARAGERSLDRKVPLVIFSSSGGARMQEGMFSLMQMAKTGAVIGHLKQTNILYISVLTDPTFGGVSASFAWLGDIIIAEPQSLIGFAGPKVIEQTIKQKLPDKFQRAEFLLEHGMIDLIVERTKMKETLYKLIEHFMPNTKSSI